MGLLNFFSKPPPALQSLPAGTYTVDRQGSVLASTVSSGYPASLIGAISGQVLSAFVTATEAQLPLAELTITYPSLKITARALRGGAILFLSPKTPYAPSKTN